jgi:hypothetical protein
MAVEKNEIPEIAEDETVELDQGQPIIDEAVEEVTIEGEEPEEERPQDDFNANWQRLWTKELCLVWLRN